MKLIKEESTLEIPSCVIHRQRKTKGALAQEGATTAETSAGSQNWIYVKRHRSRLGQIL